MNHYLILHKPYDILTQFTDAEGRATLADYVPVPGVYAAGRLDRNSEGLLLLTNDGTLLHRVTHPRWKLPKTYLVQVEGTPEEKSLEHLRQGVIVKGKRTTPADVELLAQPPDVYPREVRQYHPTPWLRVTIREGRKRQVRRMTAAVGYPTLRLIRIAIGPLKLDALAPGEWRDLSESERHMLFRAVGMNPDTKYRTQNQRFRKQYGKRQPRK
ncbi:MAG: rRNA pseudouridine synthase [Chloroflexi bacterium]|nr:rRNA pseudouridine synthase [Chloroflexota bacterium]